MEKIADNKIEDPCADFTPVQRNAYIWFFCALLLGGILTFKFSKIDRWMYDHNAEFINVTAHKEIRHASASLQSERIDPRQGGDLVTNLLALRGSETPNN